MLLLPVVAGVVSTIVVLALVAAGIGVLGLTKLEHQAAAGEFDTRTTVTGIVVLMIAAYLGTLITVVCLGGLVKCADEELQGRDSSFGAGLSASMSRLPALLGWAAIQAAVGWLLSMIRGNGGDNVIVSILRLVLASLLAVAWSIISFFVLPMIILRGKGPLQAIKDFVALIRATWGMQLAGGVRIGGLVVLLAVLPGIVAMVGGFFLMVADRITLGVPVLVVGIVVLILAQVLVSALRAVFSVALLHYAEDGTAIGPYAEAELAGAVRVKA